MMDLRGVLYTYFEWFGGRFGQGSALLVPIKVAVGLYVSLIVRI